MRNRSAPTFYMSWEIHGMHAKSVSQVKFAGPFNKGDTIIKRPLPLDLLYFISLCASVLKCNDVLLVFMLIKIQRQ